MDVSRLSASLLRWLIRKTGMEHSKHTSEIKTGRHQKHQLNWIESKLHTLVTVPIDLKLGQTSTTRLPKHPCRDDETHVPKLKTETETLRNSHTDAQRDLRLKVFSLSDRRRLLPSISRMQLRARSQNGSRICRRQRSSPPFSR